MRPSALQDRVPVGLRQSAAANTFAVYVSGSVYSARDSLFGIHECTSEQKYLKYFIMDQRSGPISTKLS